MLKVLQYDTHTLSLALSRVRSLFINYKHLESEKKAVFIP